MLRRCVVVVNELRLEMWSSLVARYYGHALLLHVHMTTIAMCSLTLHSPYLRILPLHSGVCRTLVLLGKPKLT